MDFCLCPPSRRVASSLSLWCVVLGVSSSGVAFVLRCAPRPSPTGRGATSSLLLSNICIQLLWRRCVGGDSARRRGVTDVSPSRWVASLQSLPRLRATLSIVTCFVLRTRAVRWFFWQRALSWRAALRCRARSLSRLHKRAWKSLKGDRPTGPTHGRLLLLR